MSRCTASPGSWRSPPRSSKFVVKAPNTPLGEEAAQPGLDLRGVAQRPVPLAARQQLGRDGRNASAYSLTRNVDLGLLDGVDERDEVVTRRTCLTDVPKRSSASTLSPSVTATSRMLSPNRASQASQLGDAEGRAGPRLDEAARAGVAGVTGDRRARHAQARLDETELAVAVGGLVEVHEVHVDGPPGQATRRPGSAGAAAACAARRGR